MPFTVEHCFINNVVEVTVSKFSRNSNVNRMLNIGSLNHAIPNFTSGLFEI